MLFTIVLAHTFNVPFVYSIDKSYNISMLSDLLE